MTRRDAAARLLALRPHSDRQAAMSTLIRLFIATLVVSSCSGDDDSTAEQVIPSTTTAPSITSPPASASSEPPAQNPSGSTTASAAAPDAHAALDGHWSTGPVPIEQIRETMLQAGVTEILVDEWVVEVGSPTEYTFDLEFNGANFEHFQATPESPRQVGESGRFVYADGHLDLDIVNQGDTYRFTADESNDQLQLRFIDSTEQGTAEDKAKHARYTLAFYTSAPFVRQP